MQLKRLWDITNKKMVFVKGPTGHECQLWVDEATEKMYYYDMSQWLEYTQSAGNDGRTYGPTWRVVESDDEMGVYDTNEHTDLFVWESGDKVSYVFKDWDGTILKEGKVNEGSKPTAPADPTRAATAQYTYTFAGWNPEVAKITKKTTYTATYTATVNEYTITWVDGDGNTLDTDTVAYGSTPEYTGATPTKTATAQYTYTWDNGWTPEVVAVTGDATYTATFTSTVNQYTVTIQSNDTDYGTVDESTVTVDYGTAISSSSNELTIGNTTITATAETGYVFSSWGTLPATVTSDLTITASFQSNQCHVEGIVIYDYSSYGYMGGDDDFYASYGSTWIVNGNKINVTDTEAGNSYEIEAGPFNGYKFWKWIWESDGTEVPSTGTITGHTIFGATFEQENTEDPGEPGD